MSDSYLYDHQFDIDDAKIRYGKSYSDIDDLIYNFNISRLPDYDNASELYIPHIIMTRPSLNFSDENIKQLRLHAMTSSFINTKDGYELFRSISNQASSMYVPLITTRAMSYTVNDMSLKTIEKGNTFYGHVIKYGKHSEDHKISSSLTIDFRNDKYLSILKMMYLWECYIYLISKTDVIEPIDEHQKNAILDYCASIYYLVTRRDDSELVYWDKTVGLFPTSVPLNIFGSSDNYIQEDRIPIEFAYGIKSDPCDPSILMDLNVLSGVNSSTIQSLITTGLPKTQQVHSKNNGDIMALGDAYAKCPFVRIINTNNSSVNNVHYYLQWKSR